MGQLREIDVYDSLSLIKACDVIVAAAGHPGIIKAGYLSANAFLGIDVGNTRMGRRVVGDFDFVSVDGKLEYLTPVPGGVGPLEMVVITERIVKNAIDPSFAVDFTIR